MYEAVHKTLNRRCAIKVLQSQYANDPVIAARFCRRQRLPISFNIQVSFKFSSSVSRRPNAIFRHGSFSTAIHLVPVSGERLSAPAAAGWSLRASHVLGYRQGVLRRTSAGSGPS